jgi:hypothetical protein
MRRLGLEVVGFEKFSRPTTSKPGCNILLYGTLLARHQLHPGKVPKRYVYELKALTKTILPLFFISCGPRMVSVRKGPLECS